MNALSKKCMDFHGFYKKIMISLIFHMDPMVLGHIKEALVKERYGFFMISVENHDFIDFSHGSHGFGAHLWSWSCKCIVKSIGVHDESFMNLPGWGPTSQIFGTLHSYTSPFHQDFKKYIKPAVGHTFGV